MLSLSRKPDHRRAFKKQLGYNPCSGFIQYNRNTLILYDTFGYVLHEVTKYETSAHMHRFHKRLHTLEISL